METNNNNGLVLFNKAITSDKTQAYLSKVLADRKGSFVNNITALVSQNVMLQKCEPVTLIYAGLKATALDLPLDSNLGFAYVIPYDNKKKGVTEAQFQLGYKGFIQLAIRSGQFKNINVSDVRECEIVERNPFTGEILFASVNDRESKPIVGYVAYIKLLNGFEKFLYMTKEEVDKHANRYSKTYSSSIEYIRKSSKWTTDFDAMAKKTVLKLLLSKFAPLSVEMQTAIKADQSVLSENNEEYVDNDSDFRANNDEVEEQEEPETIKEKPTKLAL